MNKLLTNCLPKTSLNFDCKRLYRQNKGILRGQYFKKQKDGTPFEYNESITVVPNEFQNQGTR